MLMKKTILSLLLALVASVTMKFHFKLYEPTGIDALVTEAVILVVEQNFHLQQ